MIVTRFAPSPTGYLHVGGARTALFNWLLARQNGGKFILRIEDTDVKRNTPTATEQVIKDLKWLGMDWDEGPGVGGPNGPYHQSERRDIYNKYLAELRAAGKAYYCFDTPEEISVLRDAAAKAKKTFLYPRPEVLPTDADVEAARAAGRPVTMRFAMPDENSLINDEVRGEVKFAAGEFSDFIIQKADGYPTYHMAVVIDDELMGVTHIMRGQEHLMNTPLHQALQDALGFRRPVYAHMSVTVSDSGGKLSKRERPKALKAAIKAKQDLEMEKLAEVGGIDAAELNKYIKGKHVPDMPAIDAMAEYLGVHLPEINVVDFFKSGYLPETMVNFLGLLGWNPGDDREVMELAEQIECFDIKRLAKSNSLFDRKKLQSFNTDHIRLTAAGTLLANLKAYLVEVDSPMSGASDEQLKRVIAVTEGARTLAEIDAKCGFAFIGNDEVQFDAKAVKKVLKKHDGLGVLAVVREKFAGLSEVTADSVESTLRGLAEEKEIGLGKVAQPLRVAICGNTVSPAIFEAVDMLGMENVLARIDNTLAKFTE
jgi:glutamyl/glutaminyl-tRNA synthetase